MRRAFAIARNIDTPPPGGVEIFGSLVGNVPNDGAFHLLAEPAGVPPLQIDPTFRIVVDYVRAEWSTVDVTVPPPLTLQVFVNGTSSVAFQTLASLMLLATALNTPAFDAFVSAFAQPGATISAQVKNTGAVAQLVDVFFSGWAYPQTLVDGEGYGAAAA
jgi:hypothetical protein